MKDYVQELNEEVAERKFIDKNDNHPALCYEPHFSQIKIYSMCKLPLIIARV